MIIAEYVWLDAENNFRSKFRVLPENNLSSWNYDGSSTGQATTESSEVILKVVYSCKHPFIDGFIYLCATYDINDNPLSNNYYHNAKKIFDKNNIELKPWFGLELDYSIINSNIYYCSPINQPQIGNKIAMEHLEACIKANLNISGINAEVVINQWEFQIGPVEGIDAGNQLMIARYLLNIIASKYDMKINYHPKPFKSLNGSGCHVNFSTQQMRADNGLEYIYEAINKLSNNHKIHMENYGIDNKLRMTGKNETANYDNFTWGVGSRNTSIRIGYDTFKNNKGYFEDRRPASNIDPYLVTGLIFNTCCL